MELPRIARLLQPFLEPHNASTSSDHSHPSPDHCHSEEQSAKDFCHSEEQSDEACHSEEQSDEESAFLSTAQLQSISTYIDILLRWNARINLTAIRNPEDIVTRHFSESLFAARHLFPATTRAGTGASPVHTERSSAPLSVADVGSGAGFPGLPIKLWVPQISLTLIESNHKKATFLREVARALTLTDINIQTTRVEHLLQKPDLARQDRARQDQERKAGQDFQPPFNVVTLRAVERFPVVLPNAASLVAPGGRLALLIGSAQQAHVLAALPTFRWSPPTAIPMSTSRTLLLGTREPTK